MGRSDDKFAWLKTDAVNEKIERWLRRGDNVEYDDLVAATDPDGSGDAAMISFETASAGSAKNRYVIFQYGVLIRDRRGRLAIFTRVGDDKGRGPDSRSLPGPSFIVSGSRMMAPGDALESILNEKLSFGRRTLPGTFRPLGFARTQQPRRGSKPNADYLFCLYELTLDDNRLNGLVRENPDTFHGWSLPSEIQGAEGPIDTVLLGALQKPGPLEPQLSGVTWYQPASRLADGNDVVFPLEPFEVPGCRTVFLSHDAAAQLKAYLLRDVLVKRSAQRLYPFLDMHEVYATDGPFWPRIKHLIERSDVFLILVTEGTAKSPGVKIELEYARSLPQPPEIVAIRVDGQLSDVPPDVLEDNILDYTGRQYRFWHNELEGLIENLVARPFRERTLRARDPEELT